MAKEKEEKKPFYKRWWFIALVVMAIAGAFIGDDEESAESEEPEQEEVVETESETEQKETVEESEPEEEIEEESKPEELTREEEIEQVIRNRAKSESNYSGFKIDNVRVNDNMGDEESDTYIVLVDLIWERKNKVDTADEMIDMVSQDIAANLHNEGAEDVAEIAIFTDDEYNDRDIKYSYEWKEAGFVLTDQVAN